MSITEDGVDEVVRRLSVALAPYLRAGRMAIAAELQNVIAPYPPAPPRRGRSWYERGYGRRWRTKDGRVRGRKTSEALGRRWAIVDGPEVTTLENRASYAYLVHGDRQAKVHKGRGWVTTGRAISTVRPNLGRIFMGPMLKAFGGDGDE